MIDMKVWKWPKCGQNSASIKISKYDLKANISCGMCHLFSELKITKISEPVDVYGDFIDLFHHDLISNKKNSEKIEHESFEVLITTKKVLKALSNDWKSLPQLQNDLGVEDHLDIRFLKIKLKQFERENKIKSRNIENNKYWIIKRK